MDGTHVPPTWQMARGRKNDKVLIFPCRWWWPGVTYIDASTCLPRMHLWGVCQPFFILSFESSEPSSRVREVSKTLYSFPSKNMKLCSPCTHTVRGWLAGWMVRNVDTVGMYSSIAIDKRPPHVPEWVLIYVCIYDAPRPIGFQPVGMYGPIPKYRCIIRPRVVLGTASFIPSRQV